MVMVLNSLFEISHLDVHYYKLNTDSLLSKSRLCIGFSVYPEVLCIAIYAFFLENELNLQKWNTYVCTRTQTGF